MHSTSCRLLNQLTLHMYCMSAHIIRIMASLYCWIWRIIKHTMGLHCIEKFRLLDFFGLQGKPIKLYNRYNATSHSFIQIIGIPFLHFNSIVLPGRSVQFVLSGQQNGEYWIVMKFPMNLTSASCSWQLAANFSVRPKWWQCNAIINNQQSYITCRITIISSLSLRLIKVVFKDLLFLGL